MLAADAGVGHTAVDVVAPARYTREAESIATAGQCGTNATGVCDAPVIMAQLSSPEPPRYVENESTGSITSVRLRSYSPI